METKGITPEEMSERLGIPENRLVGVSEKQDRDLVIEFEVTRLSDTEQEFKLTAASRELFPLPKVQAVVLTHFEKDSWVLGADDSTLDAVFDILTDGKIRTFRTAGTTHRWVWSPPDAKHGVLQFINPNPNLQPKSYAGIQSDPETTDLDLDQLQSSFDTTLWRSVNSISELEKVQRAWLGKAGILNRQLHRLASYPVDLRLDRGNALNQLVIYCKSKLATRAEELEPAFEDKEK